MLSDWLVGALVCFIWSSIARVSIEGSTLLSCISYTYCFDVWTEWGSHHVLTTIDNGGYVDDTCYRIACGII